MVLSTCKAGKSGCVRLIAIWPKRKADCSASGRSKKCVLPVPGIKENSFLATAVLPSQLIPKVAFKLFRVVSDTLPDTTRVQLVG